jgi:hypothetical protein
MQPPKTFLTPFYSRLARLHVTESNETFHVTTNNVHSFSIKGNKVHQLSINGILVPVVTSDGVIRLHATEARGWKVRPVPDTFFILVDCIQSSTCDLPISAQPPGRIQAILTSAAPLTIVAPDKGLGRERSSALRIAHSLNVYHKLDTNIIDSSEALKKVSEGTLGSGNIVVIGDPATPFVQYILAEKKTPFRIDGASLTLAGRHLVEPGLGMVTFQ